MKKIIVYITLFIFLSLNFYWFIYTATEIDNYTFFGFFRYESFWDLKDNLYHEGLEKRMFSYECKFPYLYVYGISGYTKVSVIPVYTQIEKIPNMEFYNIVENDDSYKERVSDVYTTYSRLLRRYGSSIKIYDSLQDVSPEDYQVYKQLQEKGKEHKKGSIFYNTSEEEAERVLKGLDDLE